jgi:hypothetical protein
LATSFWSFNSTESRDKVYALPGLAHGLARDLVYPQYERSLPDVFFEVAAAIIQDERISTF